jgi:hypothetical protein
VGSLVTFAYVNFSDDLPNGSHLEVNDAIKLRAGDTKLAPSGTETTLSASEGYFAQFDWQVSYLDADALCHRPAMSYPLFGIVRQPSFLPRCQSVLGRAGQATGSLLDFAVCLR